MSPPRDITCKRYLTFPTRRALARREVRIARHLWGMAVMPAAMALAAVRGTPGLRIRRRTLAIGLQMLARRDYRAGWMMLSYPMDSLRYFELDFVQRVVADADPVTYLDVSSPRLVPLMILQQRPALTADIINPIADDLDDTQSLARSLNVTDRCRTAQQFVEEVSFADGSFDLITSISVVEHIPDEETALAKIWRLLRPGGRLILTVPCKREAEEEYTNLDEYALFDADRQGFVYWQRYYDQAALETRIFAITGSPVRTEVYGEKTRGNYDRNVQRKRTDPQYPYWWEPAMMGREYRRFDSIDRLPGMGVVALEFYKPA